MGKKPKQQKKTSSGRSSAVTNSKQDFSNSYLTRSWKIAKQSDSKDK